MLCGNEMFGITKEKECHEIEQRKPLEYVKVADEYLTQLKQKTNRPNDLEFRKLGEVIQCG